MMVSEIVTCTQNGNFKQSSKPTIDSNTTNLVIFWKRESTFIDCNQDVAWKSRLVRKRVGNRPFSWAKKNCWNNIHVQAWHFHLAFLEVAIKLVFLTVLCGSF